MKKKLLALGAAAVFALTGLFAAACDNDSQQNTGSDDTQQEQGSDDIQKDPDDGKGDDVKERELRVLREGFTYKIDQTEHTVAYTDSEGKNITLYGNVWAPLKNGKYPAKYPAVILCHGFNGHYTDFPTECQAFAERGYVCYAFDFCGAQAGGKSTGRTAADYTPFTMKEDLRAAIVDIKTLDNVDGTQIFLFGGSQGGFITALTAADEDIKDQIAAVAMYFPALNIPEDWHGKPEVETSPFPGFSISGKYIHSVQDLDPYAVIGNYEKDICIIWGDQDNIVRREFIDRAVETYGKERVELTVIKGAGHGFVPAVSAEAAKTVLKFMESRTYVVE